MSRPGASSTASNVDKSKHDSQRELTATTIFDGNRHEDAGTVAIDRTFQKPGVDAMNAIDRLRGNAAVLLVWCALACYVFVGAAIAVYSVVAILRPVSTAVAK